jgi:peptidoglycan hydrolase CwlO-like protein
MGGSNKNNTLEKKVDDILDIVIFLKDSIGDQFNTMDNRFMQVDSRFTQIDNRFDKMDNRLEYMSQDIKEVKQRITNIETDVHSLKKQSHEDTDVLAKDIFDHEVRIVRLEKQYV